MALNIYRFTLLTINVLLITHLAFSQKTWTGANNNNWNDDGNWNPSGVPNGDAVIIDMGTVNIQTSTNANVGTLSVSGATLELFGASSLTIGGTSSIESGSELEVRGTLTLNGNLTVSGTLIQSAGSITGPGDLTIDGTYNWNGSIVEVSGQFVNNGTINLTSGQLEAVLDNQGMFEQNGTLIINDNGKYNNNGTHDFQSNGDINGGGTNLGFTNNSSLIKSAGTSRSDILVEYDGAGSVEAQIGTIDFRGNSTQSGTLISSGGSIRFPTTTHSFAGVTIGGSGSTEINGGTVSIDTDVSAVNLDLSGGAIIGAGNLTISGTINWTGGNLGNTTNTGQIIISGVLNKDSGGQLQTTLINDGVFNWNGSSWTMNSNAALINNNTFTINVDNEIFTQGVSQSQSIQNNGLWEKVATFGFQTRMHPEFENTGTVSVEAGTLRFHGGTNSGTITTSAGAGLEFSGSSSVFTNESNGSIGGSGNINNIDGILNNNGTLSPGNSPGAFAINDGAKVNFGATSIVNIEIAGTTPETEHDQLNITGNFDLDGTLNVSFIDMFEPTAGQTFDVVSYTSHIGSFSNVTIESVDGLLFGVSDAGGKISVTAATEPDLFDYHVESTTFSKMGLENPVAINLTPKDLSEVILIGFEFNFFGNVLREIYISEDGYIAFDDNTSSSQSIPSIGQPNDLMAAFWSNLTQQPNGVINYSTNGIAPNRSFIVDYKNIRQNETGETLNFQIQLFETSYRIEFHCEDCPGGTSPNTQGIENRDGTKAFYLSGRNDEEFGLNDDGVSFTPFSATPTSQTEVILNFSELTLEGTLSRSTDGVNFTQIASNLAVGSTTFTDIGLSPFTEYYYQLQASFESDEPVLAFFMLKTQTLTDPVEVTSVSASDTEVEIVDVN